MRRVDGLRVAYVEFLDASLRTRMLYFYQVGEHTSSILDAPARSEQLKQKRRDLLLSGAN